jgi:transcriptional regulator with GAF, ATPase, and Fis domain
MFGHEQGAFTGASQRRIGRFECADRGTLFLDEVGELSPEMQVALLRVVQEGEFERLGASQTRRVDVRLVAATNRSLQQDVDDGRFRSDLFYRLNVFPVHLPPLRERREDVPLLAEFFLRQLSSRLDRQIIAISPESLDRLMAYSWPGNVRELQNVIEHSAILCDDAALSVPAELLIEKNLKPDVGGALEKALQHSELLMIEQALERAEGRVSGAMGAAARLGVPASTLESKIKRYHIDKLKYRAARQPRRDPVSTRS